MRRGSHDDYDPVVGFWRRVDLQADSDVSGKNMLSPSSGASATTQDLYNSIVIIAVGAPNVIKCPLVLSACSTASAIGSVRRLEQ